MTRKVSAEVDLVHQQTQNQRYCSLSLHDALPIFTVDYAPQVVLPFAFDVALRGKSSCRFRASCWFHAMGRYIKGDRKSTRLNSSHGYISYAVFCLNKKSRISGMALLILALLQRIF